MWVRGLKQRKHARKTHKHLSHPMWVRGLKPVPVQVEKQVSNVAPYVGAWIETTMSDTTHVSIVSHPMWVRGLKLILCLIHLIRNNVAPYVGAWIETI